MRPSVSLVITSAMLAVMTACQQPPAPPTEPTEPTSTLSAQLRDTGGGEARADFSQIVYSFDALYGPLERKTARYGFNFADAANSTYAQLGSASTDSESFRTIARFLNRFNDGHISYSPSVLSDTARELSLPLLVTPIEGRYLVYAIGSAVSKQVARGDELVRIDGRTPQELVRQIDRFVSVPNPRTSEQLSALQVTFRSFLLPAALLPKPGTPAQLDFRRADGSTYSLSTPWRSNRPPPRLQRAPTTAAQQIIKPWALAGDVFQDLLHAQATLGQAADVGSNRPFFLTNAVVQTFGITPVRPSTATLSTFGVPPCEGSRTVSYDCYQSFAGTYTYQGKRVLLVRVPSYVPSASPGDANDARYLKAVLADFQATNDVLVIDETNNPGGQIAFALDLFSLLITEPKTNIGFAFHADRKSINDFGSAADFYATLGPDYAGFAARFEAQAEALERAYDSGQRLGPLFPLAFYDLNDDRVFPDPDVQWSKPVVVLANELSFSGGDLFPLVMKTNHAGTLFGARTAGLGGTVEEVTVTPYSQATLRLTRSLYAPMTAQNQVPQGALTEDEGVTPDIAYSPTVADFRSGYVDYVRAFSNAAVTAVR
jgi:Peptidase family S41